jgi:hypothetical protein
LGAGCQQQTHKYKGKNPAPKLHMYVSRLSIEWLAHLVIIL